MSSLLLFVFVGLVSLVISSSASGISATQSGNDPYKYLVVWWNAAERVPFPKEGSVHVRTEKLPCGVAAFSCSDRGSADRRIYVGLHGPFPVVSFMYEVGVFYADQQMNPEDRRAWGRVIRKPWNLARFADVYAFCATYSVFKPWTTYYWPSGKLRGSAVGAGCRWLKGQGTL